MVDLRKRSGIRDLVTSEGALAGETRVASRCKFGDRSRVRVGLLEAIGGKCLAAS